VIALLVAALLQAPQGAPARPATPAVQMGITVAPDTVTVGDHFTVQVRVRAPIGSTIEFPAGPDSGAAVEATDPRVIRRGADSTAAELTAIYRLAAWDTGLVRLALGDARVAGREERIVPLGGARVYVRSVLPADTAKQVPKPPRGILEAPRPWWHWLLLALVAAILLLLLGWWLWRRRRRGRGEPAADPLETAERELARIEGMGLLEAGERGRFVALVIEVLRGYLAARIPEAPASLTSSEVVRALRARAGLPAARVGALLYEADLIKFARRPVTAERAREIAAAARALVRDVHEATAPKPDDARRAA
jgi:hypothetical protein